MIRNAQIAGQLVDLRFDTLVREIAPGCAAPNALDAHGCAVLPGLHDHHIHFLAAARAATSVDLAALASGDVAGLSACLRKAPGSGWVRAVGYHERLAGDLDAGALDQLIGDRPVRLQHGSGKMWLLNTAALEALGLRSGSSGGSSSACGGGTRQGG